MSKRALMVGVLASVAALASCAALLGFEELTAGEPVEPDAQVPPSDAGIADADADAEVDAAAPPYSYCPTDWEPPDTTSSTQSWLFALDSLRVVPRDSDPLGLNLDCTDTVNADTSSCQLDPRVTGEGLALIRDLDHGIDNAGRPSISGAFALLGQDADNIDEAVKAGRVGMLLRVINAAPANSSAVRVRALPAGRVRADDVGCATEANPAPVGDAAVVPREPSFDDVWCVDQRYVDVLGAPIDSTRAWIRDGYLFASFDRLTVPFFDDRQYRAVGHARLYEAYLVARIAGEPGPTLRLEDGVLAGRWLDEDLLLESLSLAAVRSDGICRVDDVLADQARERFCAVRDISVSGSAECRGLSVGYAFTARAVNNMGEPGELYTYEQHCDRRVYRASEPAPAPGDDAGGTELFSCPPPPDAGGGDAGAADAGGNDAATSDGGANDGGGGL